MVKFELTSAWTLEINTKYTHDHCNWDIYILILKNQWGWELFVRCWFLSIPPISWMHRLMCTQVLKFAWLQKKKSVITERVLSLAVKRMQWPAWEPSPLCLNVKLKCLCSAQGETFRCCPPLNSCRKEKKMNISPPQCWPSQEMFYKIYGLFT